MVSSSRGLGGLRRVMLIRLRKERAILGDDGRETDETDSAPDFTGSEAAGAGEQNGSGRDVKGEQMGSLERDSGGGGGGSALLGELRLPLQ